MNIHIICFSSWTIRMSLLLACLSSSFSYFFAVERIWWEQSQSADTKEHSDISVKNNICSISFIFSLLYHFSVCVCVYRCEENFLMSPNYVLHFFFAFNSTNYSPFVYDDGCECEWKSWDFFLSQDEFEHGRWNQRDYSLIMIWFVMELCEVFNFECGVD